MRQSLSQFVSGLIIALIGAAVTVLGTLFVNVLRDRYVNGASDPFSAAEIINIIEYLFLVIILIAFVITFILSVRMGPSTSQVHDVLSLEVVKYSFWQRIIGIPHTLTQLRNSIISGFLICITIVILSHNMIPLWSLIVILTVLIMDSVREFYISSSLVRNSLENALEQILRTLGDQLELMMEEALGHRNFRVRCCIRIRSGDSLLVRTTYNMGGDPDCKLPIGIHQGVEGKVFAKSKPIGLFPYDPGKLDFSEDQLRYFPKNLKWKLAFPILPNRIFIGVLSIDSDTDITQEWIDKILDFTHGITSGIGIVISQYPSKNIYDSFLAPNRMVIL